MSSKWNTMPLSHGSSSTLHSSLGSVRMLSTWSGKAVCFDGNTLGCLGVVRDTQLHMCSYLRGGVGMGRQSQILGQWVCQSCDMGGCWPTRRSCFRCGAPWLGGSGGQRPPRESHYPGLPSNQELPINPTKRVLRGYNGFTSQSLPKVLPTGLVPSPNQGLADPALSLGLPRGGVGSCLCKNCNTKSYQEGFSGKTVFVASRLSTLRG